MVAILKELKDIPLEELRLSSLRTWTMSVLLGRKALEWKTVRRTFPWEPTFYESGKGTINLPLRDELELWDAFWMLEQAVLQLVESQPDVSLPATYKSFLNQGTTTVACKIPADVLAVDINEEEIELPLAGWV